MLKHVHNIFQGKTIYCLSHLSAHYVRISIKDELAKRPEVGLRFIINKAVTQLKQVCIQNRICLHFGQWFKSFPCILILNYQKSLYSPSHMHRPDLCEALYMYNVL
jgi:hypothetical protein